MSMLYRDTLLLKPSDFLFPPSHGNFPALGCRRGEGPYLLDDVSDATLKLVGVDRADVTDSSSSVSMERNDRAELATDTQFDAESICAMRLMIL